jgi:hypothetical protein
MLTPMLYRNVNLHALTTRRKLTNLKKKFCLFAVSNPENEKRNIFFQELSKYKQVDSCGKVLNNIGHRCPGKSHLSREFLSLFRIISL